MKRILLAMLILAGCKPADVNQAAAPTAPATPAAVASAQPSPVATPSALPTANPSVATIPNWPRLADLPVTTPITQARLWARSAKDVYAVAGTQDLWHYDGTAWSKQTIGGAGNLLGLTGGKNGVWVSTDAGAIVGVTTAGALTYRTAQSTAAIPAIANIDDSNLLAASTDGQTCVFTSGPAGVTGQLYNKKKGYAVAALNNQLFVAGEGGFVAWRDASTSAWQSKDDATTNTIRAVAAYTGGKAPVDLMAVGDSGISVRNSSGIFLPFGTVPARPRLNAVAAYTADGLFAAGDNGLILFFQSESWRAIISDASLGNIVAMTALGNRELIVLTSKGVVQAGPYTPYIQ